LFGPSSVTWKVHGEPIVALAGLRALFIQSLHPRALAGVLQNSDFRTRPWHRLETTATYVVTVIFGTTAEAEAAGERVRAVHSRLRATDPRTGERFRLDEPELLRWVHVVEVESFLDIARRAGVALTDAEADEYYREQRRAAALVGLDPETVPGSRAEVAAYYERIQPQLATTRDTVESMLFMAVPPMPFGLGWTPARGGFAGIAALAMGTLPAWARRRYGLPGIAATDPAASLAIRLLRAGVSTIPRRLVEGPIYRAAMQRAVQSAASPPHGSFADAAAEPSGHRRR
jgi:uncharacterized protein (DUF2236 family)